MLLIEVPSEIDQLPAVCENAIQRVIGGVTFG